MRTTFVTVVLLIFSTGVAGQPPIAPAHVGDIQSFINSPAELAAAKVSSVQIVRYNYLDGNLTDSVVVQVKYFDSLGNVLQSLTAGSQSDYLYTDGKLSLLVLVPKKHGVKGTYELYYDSIGRVSRQVTINSHDDKWVEERFYYNTDGLSKISGYDAKGRLLYIKAYSYQNNRLVAISRLEKEKVKYSREFVYDTIGGSVLTYDVKGKKRVRRAENFFSGGRLVKHIEIPHAVTYNGQEVPGSTLPIYPMYKYGSHKLVTEINSTRRMDLVYREKFVYTFRK